MKTLLGTIADFCYFHYRPILICSLLLCIPLFIRINSVTIETDFLKLFPHDNTAIGAFTDILKDFGSLDKLYFLVEKKKSLSLYEFIDDAEQLVYYLKNIRVNNHTAFKEILYKFHDVDKPGDALDILSLFIDNPLHFLEYDDIPLIKEKLSKENIVYQLSKNRKSLIGQPSFALKELILIDPLQLRSIIEHKFNRNSTGFQFDAHTGYFLSADHQSLLIIASSTIPANNMEYSRQLIHAILQYAKVQKNITITCTGANAISVSTEAIIKKDMKSSILSSLIGILILLYLVYRRFIIIFFMSIPVIIGILFTLAVTTFTSGINVLTCAFAAILVGLGIDYPIHFYDRFHSERAQGRETREALRYTLEQTGVAVLTGAVTTILAFFSLCCARINAISQFGFLTALGMLLCMLSTYIVFPSLLTWYDKNTTHYVFHPLGTYGLPKLTHHLEKHRTRYLMSFFLGTLIMVYYASQLSFEKDLMNLRPQKEPTFAVQSKIKRQFKNQGSELLISKEGKNLNTLIAQEDQIINVLERYRKRGEVLSYSSIGVCINAEEKQAELLKSLTKNINFQEVNNTFDECLKESGFNKTYFQRIETFFKTFQQVPPTPSTSPEIMRTILKKTPLGNLIDMYAVLKGETFKIVTPLFLKSDESILPHLLDDLEQIGHNVRITGTMLISQELLTMVKSDLIRCLSVAAVLIFLCVSIHFRSVMPLLLAFIPICMGTLWMAGSMALCNIKLDVVNVVILPMIMGVGIDNGVHIIHRYLGNKIDTIEETVSHTGRAISMCSLTTIIGFGSLISSTYNALALMGLSIALGMVFCLFHSLITLPLLLTFFYNRNKRGGGGVEQEG